MLRRILLTLCIVCIAETFRPKIACNAVAKAIIGIGIVVNPSSSTADNALLEKKAKFSIGAGIHKSEPIVDKKAKFSIG